MPSTQALVLNEHGCLCGVGEAGEIVIRTRYRTKGYLNANESDARRFYQNPFRDDPDDLLYRTGDGGRYAIDGTLEILGRVDHQVKVRGVRVEPAEITAVLSNHPDVRSCVVTSSKDKDERVFLIAYVVPQGADGVEREALVGYLRDRLPLAMVPTAFVILDSLPRLPNGKVDRRALPPPELDAISDERSYAAPRTPMEKTLAEIWVSVLGVGRVGIHDEFFALGGHSLRAMQVVSRIRDALSVELPIRDLFENTTIASLSVCITEAQASGIRGAEMDDMIREIQNLSEEELKAIIEAESESGSDA